MKGKYFHRNFVWSVLPTWERKSGEEDGDWVPLWWVADQCDANWTSLSNMPQAVAEKLKPEEALNLLPDEVAQGLVRPVLNHLVALGKVERMGDPDHYFYRQII